MDPYLFCLILGFLGLVIMAGSGLAAHGGDHGGGHHGHAKELGGHGHGHGLKELGGHHGHDAGHGVHVKELGGHHGHDAGVHVKDLGHHGAHVKDVGHAHVKDAGQHARDIGHHAKDVAQLQDGSDGGDGGGVGDDLGDYLLSLLSPRVAFSILTGVGAAGLLLDDWLPGLLLLVVAIAAGLAFEGLLVRPFWNFLFRFASTPAQTLETSLMDRATAVTGFDAQGQGIVSIIMNGEIVQLLGTLRPEDRAAGVRVRTGDALTVEDVDGKRNRCVVSWQGASAPADER
jgi:hypothetical protein